MNIQDLLSGSTGQELIKGLSQQTGEDQSKIASAVSMAAPFILGQLTKNAQSKEGAESLDKALNQHQGSILDNVSGLLSGNTLSEGSSILGHIFGGNKETVANSIGQKTGMSSGSVMQVLMALAPVIMGFLGKEKQEKNVNSNGLTGMLGSILGGAQGGSSDMSFIEKMLDQNGDGNVMDDAMNIGGKLLGGFFKK